MENNQNDIKKSKARNKSDRSERQDGFSSQYSDSRPKRKNGRRQTAMHRNRWYDLYLELYKKPQLAIIPVVILLIIILIVLYNKNVKRDGNHVEASTAESAITETTTVIESQPETEDPTIVREYYDEYLTAFFEQYFDARLEADTDALYTLTGVNNRTEEQTEQFKNQLKTQAGYIEAYQDIKQYAVNAIEDNSKLVFVTYDVKFRRVETLAPGIMYCYVKVNDSNEFEIVENLTPEQTKFVNEYITNHEEVQEIINSSNSKLLQAISSDERLAVIYDAFQSGRIYTDSQEEIDSEVSLIAVDGAEITGTIEEETIGTEETAGVDESSGVESQVKEESESESVAVSEAAGEQSETESAG